MLPYILHPTITGHGAGTALTTTQYLRCICELQIEEALEVKLDWSIDCTKTTLHQRHTAPAPAPTRFHADVTVCYLLGLD